MSTTLECNKLVDREIIFEVKWSVTITDVEKICQSREKGKRRGPNTQICLTFSFFVYETQFP